MADIVYTTGLPNPPNAPSQDVGGMQQNTNAIDTWVQQDHFGFNTGGATANLGGYHDQVSLKNQGAPGIPANTDGVLYADAVGGNSWPQWQNALGTFQLTGSASANNPSIAGATNPVSPYSNGWTFLPGGFIMQWGVIVAGTGVAGDTIPFYVTLATTPVLFVATAHGNTTNNINFPNECFNVQATLIPSLGPVPAPPTTAGTISVTNLATTGFSFRGITGNYIGFYWTALGR